jgi:hypothetical protein
MTGNSTHRSGPAEDEQSLPNPNGEAAAGTSSGEAGANDAPSSEAPSDSRAGRATSLGNAEEAPAAR